MLRAHLVIITANTEEKQTFLHRIYEDIADYIPQIPKAFQDQFRRDGKWSLHIPFLPDSDVYAYVLEQCRQHELEYRIYHHVHYTKTEMDKTEYFQMYLPDPLELEGTVLTSYGTQYEECCPFCGFGGSLSGNALVDRKFMKKYRMGVIPPEYFVSEEIKECIQENGFTGVSFERQIVDYKGREMAPFYVMRIHHTLPPMANSVLLCVYTNDRKNRQICGHHVQYLRSDVQYEAEKLVDAKDFNLSFEAVNNDRMPVLVISARVRNCFRKKRLFAHYEPVAIL